MQRCFRSAKSFSFHELPNVGESSRSLQDVAEVLKDVAPWSQPKPFPQDSTSQLRRVLAEQEQRLREKMAALEQSEESARLAKEERDVKYEGLGV